MDFNGIKCDECPAIKKEANKWWKVWVYSHAVDASNGAVEAKVTGFSMGKHQPYTMAVLNCTTEKRDLCSESCLHKHISKILTEIGPIES
jgi:hypothetical protein